MATNVFKIDSNVTGLRIAKEQSIGVLPTTPKWVQAEPNDYSELGSKISTLVRNPITDGRQRKKGVVVDAEATGGFSSDLTQTNFQEILQGVFFASYRSKAERNAIPSVAAPANTYALTNTAGFSVGTLVNATGFTNLGNNGLKRVTTVTSNASITVTESLVAEAAPPAESSLIAVGFQFNAADAVINVAGLLPALITTTKNLTELGLTPGEWVYIGGDTTALAFAQSANNGWKRVRSVSANKIEFDKSNQSMVADTGTGKTIQMFFGRKLQNEVGTNIVRSTYQMEVSLGVPDTTKPTEVQSMYIPGCIPNQFNINVATASKITTDISFFAQNSETRTGSEGLKPGSRPVLVDADAFNTSTDLKRIKMSEVSSNNAAVSPFFAYVTDLSLSINNNLKPLKAAGVLGAFDVSAGTFAVSGSVTAYFTDVQAIRSIRANADITLDVIFVKNNSGFVIDLPLLSLGGGSPDIQLDEPVKLPLNIDAAAASRISPQMDYTAAMMFYDYLPDAAEA